MHDLRRQALEGGKTVSRKARSKQSSRASSRAPSVNPSPAHSRNASRHASDDEEGNLSDGTSWSVNSIDEMLTADDADSQAEAWREDLGDRIEQIIDRKRSSITGRQESLSAYCKILTARYAQEQLQGKTEELVGAMLKSIKSETSEKESTQALKALALTLITDPSDTIYDMIYNPLKRAIDDSSSTAVKTSAIHALSIAVFYGGASSPETESIMDYLLEIIESDGVSVGASDAADVVTAALEEWGFLATQIEDLEEASQDAVEAFVNQLESSEPSVQIAAGENIALVFEKSYTELEDDEEAGDSSDDEDNQGIDRRSTPKMVKRYQPYRRPDQLRHQLAQLASISSRRLSKKDKKSLHTNFADILNSVEHPTRGPRYQNALNFETGRSYGSRMTVRIHKTGVMRIDAWWKLFRLQALRRALGAGFLVHYEKNEVVFESLPIMIVNDS